MLPISPQYNVAAPDSLVNKITRYQRRKMFHTLIASFHIQSYHSLLDVGATSDRSYDHSNYLEAWYSHKACITAVGIDDGTFLESLYPGVKFVRADGLHLPFPDCHFDFVHSSAVLEHVGAREQQMRFIQETWRVTRQGIFLTTPNRCFPVEFHTALPLIHWLPPVLYRRILVLFGYEFFAEENNLNLISRKALAGLARAAGIKEFEIRSVSLFGMPTNLILIARKRS